MPTASSLLFLSRQDWQQEFLACFLYLSSLHGRVLRQLTEWLLKSMASKLGRGFCWTRFWHATRNIWVQWEQKNCVLRPLPGKEGEDNGMKSHLSIDAISKKKALNVNLWSERCELASSLRLPLLTSPSAMEHWTSERPPTAPHLLFAYFIHGDELVFFMETMNYSKSPRHPL